MTLDARKGKNNNMMFNLKVKRYAPEGQEAPTNIPDKKIETSNEKKELRKKLGISSDMDTNEVHRY